MRILNILLINFIFIIAVAPISNNLSLITKLTIFGSFLFVINNLFFNFRNNYYSISFYNILLIIFYVLTAGVSLIDGNLMLFNRYTILCIMFLFFSIFLITKKQEIDYKLLIIPLAIVVFFFSLTTLFELLNNPYASRMINSRDVDTIKFGVGGYSFVNFIFFMGLVAIAFLVFPFKKVSIYLKVLIGIFAAVCLLVVFLSNFLTSTLLMLFGMFFILFRNKPFFKVISVLLILIFIQIMPKSNVNLFEEGKTYDRIQSVIYSNNRLESIYSLFDGRESTTNKSLNVIKENPFFGLIFEEYNIKEDSFTLVGQHSYMLDTYAFFGVIPFLLSNILVCYPFLYGMRSEKNKLIKYISILFMMLLIVFLYMNNAVPSIGIAAFFVLNVYLDKLKSKNYSYNNL